MPFIIKLAFMQGALNYFIVFKYVLSAYNSPGTPLSTWDIAIKQNISVSVLMSFHSQETSDKKNEPTI